MMRRALTLSTAVLALLAGAVAVRTGAAENEKKPAVAGTWTGYWTIYAPPAEGAPAPPAPQITPKMKMDCKVEQSKDGKWQATFEGDCGRPYRYKVVMPGRQEGGAVLFNGTADLGEKDGGVFDWIGRATDKEFVGFYTSKGYTGTFRLARPPKAE